MVMAKMNEMGTSLQLGYNVLRELRAMEQRGSLARIEVVSGRLVLSSPVPLAVVRESWPSTEQYHDVSPLLVVLGVPVATEVGLPASQGGSLDPYVEFNEGQIMVINNRAKLSAGTGDSPLARICSQLTEASNRGNQEIVNILKINQATKIYIVPRTYVFGVPPDAYKSMLAGMQRPRSMPATELTATQTVVGPTPTQA